MDSILIKHWNEKVGVNDDVYILGDLSYKSYHGIDYYMEKLEGHKHLIIGNHDEYWMQSTKDLGRYFESVSYMDMINNLLITLGHYPMFEWNRNRYIKSQVNSKSWMIYGHIHNSMDCEAYKVIKKKLICELNAGVDINNYEPVTFDELVFNNNKWYERNEISRNN